jgi:hypothetical protein
MSNNVKNPMKVITGPDTRWSYANIWEPKSINGGAPKYSVSLIVPKSDKNTVGKIKAAVEAAYHEGEAKLKGNGKPCHLWQQSRIRCETGMSNARTILHMPMHTSSMQTPRLLPALWMLNAIPCSSVLRFIPVSMAAPASISTPSTPMAIRA